MIFVIRKKVAYQGSISLIKSTTTTLSTVSMDSSTPITTGPLGPSLEDSGASGSGDRVMVLVVVLASPQAGSWHGPVSPGQQERSIPLPLNAAIADLGSQA